MASGLTVMLDATENPPSVALRRHLPPKEGDKSAIPQAELSAQSPLPMGEGGATEPGGGASESRFCRTELLFGPDGMEKLSKARVAVFGLGGVGGYAAEALVRSGVGTLDLIDHDRVAESNLNRQILATADTIGRCKADVARERALSINPDAVVTARKIFYAPDAEFDFTRYDYIVDAIDTVTAKLSLAERAYASGVPLISCMGTGNKLRPGMLEVSDIYETSVCPLARVMRKELRKRGVPRLKVVWSREEPLTPRPGGPVRDSGRPAPGSTAFVPAAAGLMLAAEVVRDLLSR